MLMYFRCVPDNERAYALGVQWIFLSLLGSMPGPVLFGIFIDKSCALWEKTCSGIGNCLQYDNVYLSYMLCGATCLFQGQSNYIFSYVILLESENLLSENVPVAYFVLDCCMKMELCRSPFVPTCYAVNLIIPFHYHPFFI